MTKESYQHKELCLLCGNHFPFGNHSYRGRKIQGWDLMLCTTCIDGNWDGIVPSSATHLLKFLQNKGIEVQYDINGYIPIPP